MQRFLVSAVLAMSLAACSTGDKDPKSQILAPSSDEVKTYFDSDEYKRGIAAAKERMARDEAVVERAEWIGKTGLGDDVERELPRYLRRELGQYLDEPGAVKASDLSYLGAFLEHDGTVHYWRVSHQGEGVYAYIVTSEQGTITAWGGRKPPNK
jgi:hypothetical protein